MIEIKPSRDGSTFDIYVDRNYAGHLMAWGYPEEDEGQIGYRLVQSFRGKGLMTLALSRVLDKIPLNYRQLFIEKGNWRSQMVAIRCGFIRISTECWRHPSYVSTSSLSDRCSKAA